MNKLILPCKGKRYSGTRSRGLVWLENSQGNSFPNHFLKRNTKTVILYSHGNGGTLGDFKAIVNFYSDWFSTSVFAIEYPGYGPAEGEASEKSVNDNLTTAYKFLTEELGYPTSHIILIGYSIGTGPVINLGSTLCVANNPPGAVVTIAAFKSLCDIVADWKGTMFASILAGVLKNRWDSITQVATLDCPVMFIHGQLDEVIPVSHSEMLYAACVSEKKTLRICPHADHAKFNEPFDTVDAISHFLQDHMTPNLSVEIKSVPYERMQCPPTVSAKEKLVQLNKINENMTLIGENGCIGGDRGCVSSTFYNIFFFWLPEDGGKKHHQQHTDVKDHYKIEDKKGQTGQTTEHQDSRKEQESNKDGPSVSHTPPSIGKKPKKELKYPGKELVTAPDASPDKHPQGLEMSQEDVLEVAIKVLSQYFEALSSHDVDKVLEKMDDNVLVRYPEEPGKPNKSWAGLLKAQSRYAKMFRRSPKFTGSFTILTSETEGFYGTLMASARFECKESGLNVLRDILYVIDSAHEKVIIIDHK